MKHIDKKMVYFCIGCVTFAFMIIGATYAYFTASVTNYNTVTGNTATVSFGLAIEKVTTVDMGFGLVPMRNNQAPYAAYNGCYDDFGNAGCQMYKITVSADSDTVMFLDGYIVITPRDERLETRFTEVFWDKTNEVFYTEYKKEDFGSADFDESEVIKTGARGSAPEAALNHTDDYQCLLIENEKIGGDVGRTREFYMMIWVYDNGEAQDYLQGMQLAYSGDVSFVTAEGNEISATFD